jgi:hypothetical protein
MICVKYRAGVTNEYLMHKSCARINCEAVTPKEAHIMFNQTNRSVLAVMIILAAAAWILLLLPAEVQADTYVSGPITTDTTWNAAGSPYIITSTVNVMNGVQLTIQPNVVVKFNLGTSLEIDGALVAQDCTFTTNDATPARGDWGHIFFKTTSVDAIFDMSGNYVAGSMIQGCLVEWGGGGAGVNGAIEVGGASPYLYQNTIRENGDSGIHATGRSATNPIVIRENSVTQNSGSTAGGGVYVVAGSVISNTIANNSIYAHDGGGIHASASTLTGNTIADNQVTASIGGGRGGGVFATGSTLINNTVNSNSTSPRDGGNGGGIYASGCTLTGNTVNGNSAYRGVGSVSGGGIYAEGGTIENNVVHGNSISNGSFSNPAVRGAGIYASLGTITGNDVANNTANGSGNVYGGGIYAAGSTTSNNIVSSNAANGASNYTGFGGGVYVQGGSLHDNTIQSNSATGREGWGGGVYNDVGAVEGNEVAINNATLGGAVYSEQGSVMGNSVLTNTTQMTGTIYMKGGTAASNSVRGNTASYGGGLFGDGATLVGNIVQNNEATVAGGGIYAVSGTVNGNMVNENNTQNNGGGIYATAGTFSGNVVSGNTAPLWGRGSGAYLSGPVRFTYNSIVTNTATGGSVAGLAVDGLPLELRYNNIHQNQPYDAELISAVDVDVTLNYWGLAACTAIPGQLYDGHDLPGRGRFLYAPSLYSPTALAQMAVPDNLTLTQINEDAVILAWQSVPDVPDIGCRQPDGDASEQGYRIYYGPDDLCTFEGQYLPEGTSPIDVGQSTSITLTGIANAGSLHFAVTAYDYLDRESPFSNQVWIHGVQQEPLFLPFVTNS